MTSGEPLRIGVVGGFGHAPEVFRELVGVPEAVAAVGWAPAFAGETADGIAWHPWMEGVERFSEAASLYKTARPEVVIVSTRPDQIQPTALGAIAAGAHVIVEKPLAVNGTALRQLDEAARVSGRKVMAMLSMRSMPAFVAAREVVAAGRIGRPVLLNARKSYQWGTRPEWFGDRGSYGGTWLWVGIHALDVAHFVTGLHATRAWARHGNQAHPELAGCEDTAAGTFALEGGATLSVSLDLCRPGTAPTWGDDWLRVVGTEGVLEANGSTGRLELLGAEGVEVRECGTEPVPIYLPFLRALAAGEGGPDPTAFSLTASALAARASADTDGDGVEVGITFGKPDD